jgi:cytochrome d ubiquinol oxidase subunit II
MIYMNVVLFFLAISLLLYVLLGGADFGAGILELFLIGNAQDKKPELQRKIISRAMAPVWEANHIWLILAVVILFVGFPSLYEYLSVYLHLPMMAVLMGIVARGCAFTFRHYDTYSDEYFKIYSRIFSISSLWTSFFLGVVAGAIILGSTDINAQSFQNLYIDPWFNSFCVFMGLFTSCLFAFLAAIYLTGETSTPELQKIFRKKAGIANILLIPLGATVFLTAQKNGLPLIDNFFQSRISLLCWIVATVLLFPFWKILRAPLSVKNIFYTRILGALIVFLVLTAWYAVQYPVGLRIRVGEVSVPFSFERIAAPPETLRALSWTLFAGAIIIFPALAYLINVFKRESLKH